MQEANEDNTGWRRALRRDMVARRAALSEAEHDVLSARIVAHLIAALPVPQVVAFCWPIKHEPDVRAIVPHPVVHPRPCRILNDVGMCVPGSGLEEAGVRRADQHRARLVQCAQIGLEAFCLRGISHRGLLGCEKRNCEQASKPY